eukprot:CAMPEP_0204869316 /NCGR_PEP_ID=MMETSP1348-20121228/29254_1 /ASSEMBLY_ACC=CAM_ASM_000700 /TAXON_ID=215587 /ORGANISM="Aplanochytrium stocchinoi, Strain GSBS06" /LENGTH=62 /DNA_ID=CAMNT_0052022629 /DNA_START=8 /DNA_END=196 /DNA_ORIENTATION=-
MVQKHSVLPYMLVSILILIVHKYLMEVRIITKFGENIRYVYVSQAVASPVLIKSFASDFKSV